MLKAALFDDEFIVLKGLIKLIDWQSCGVELVATAKDGLSALEAVREHKPDIVLTDIRMPGMNGLELIETIREELPDTKCIVFSGYNEFDYVKRALTLGVIDYLEKPITLAKIKEGIQKAVERIETQSQVSRLKHEWEQELLAKKVKDLVLQGGEDAVSHWRGQSGMEAAQVVGVTVAASSEDVFTMTGDSSYKLIPVRVDKEHVAVIFHYDLNDEAWKDELLAKEQATIGSGCTYRSPAEAALSYKEALRALRYGKYLEDQGWTRFEELGDPSAIDPHLSDREEEVLFQLRIGDKPSLMNTLDNFLVEFKKERLEPEQAEMELLRLVLLGLEAAKETGGNHAEIKPPGYLPQMELRRMQTMEEMAAWLRKEMEGIIDWMLRIRNKAKHAAVEKAIEYIDSHFGRDLTQQEVADHVAMNVTYFSLLFKEQMGLSYIKYLTNIRMEKAKELLGEGVPVQEISERVGYYHARHFAVVFKKYTGMTPGQFRLKGKGS